MIKSRFFTLSLVLVGLIKANAAISFSFDYKDINTGFNDATYGTMRRAELESAANFLASHFLTDSPITLTYSVASTNDSASRNLASAGSAIMATEPGFFATVVQHKIITGTDLNGADADGEINFNLGQSWGFGASIASNQYDFYATAIHEVLHSFGFLSIIGSNGKGAAESELGNPDIWSGFDSFLTTSDGTFLIDHEEFGYNTTVGLEPLTSGIFFSGTNAMAAYGGRVPLFSPNPWEDGSSGSHMDDTTFTNTDFSELNSKQLMNAADGFGIGRRTLSGIERGILRDLEYSVIPEPGTWALLILGGGFLLSLQLRRRQTKLTLQVKLRCLLLATILASLVPAQAAISFSFNYQDVNTGFNDSTYGNIRRAELESAASFLASHFLTSSDIVLTYSVSSDDAGDFLASAGSDLIGPEGQAGFYSTIVQHKILTGEDSNGTNEDGNIKFNLSYSWGYGSSIAGDQYDFYSTAIHEVLHSFGFLSYMGGDGQGGMEPGYGEPDSWTMYDSFLTTNDGTFLIDHTTFGYDTAVGLGPLTSGLFFSGSNAVAAYGGLVPLYAPNVWEQGSSASHLDDVTFTSTNPAALNALQLMNANTDMGLGVRTLSDLELGILRDLNYNVIPEPGTWALFVLGGGFVVALRLRQRRLNACIARPARSAM